MFDFFSQSVDGSIILACIIACVVFFLYGPQKVYESLFGALLWLGLSLFLQHITFITPDITRNVLFGESILERRETLLWLSHGLTIFLFFFAPISLWIHAGGVMRGSLWFLLKIGILSVFFVLFGVVLFWVVAGKFAFITQAPLFSQSIFQDPFFTNSLLYNWIVDRAYLIIFVGFMLAFYKIVLSHWMIQIGLLLAALYVKWDEIFGKKTFDYSPAVWAEESHSWHDEHAWSESHSWH